MASPFAAALAQMDADLDLHLGERICVIPMRSGEFRAAPNPDRPDFELTAQVTETDPSAAAVGGMDVRVDYEEYEVQIRWDLLPAGAKIAKDDEIILLERPMAPRWRVSRTERSDRGRLILVLAPIAGDTHA